MCEGVRLVDAPEVRGEVHRPPSPLIIVAAVVPVTPGVENLFAVVIVPLALVSVAQHGVGMLQFLKPYLCFRLIPDLPINYEEKK